MNGSSTSALTFRKASIKFRFIADDEELALFDGENLENTAVHVHSWKIHSNDLILIQTTQVGGPGSPPPDTEGLDEGAADLLTKLSKTTQKITIRLRFRRDGKQGGERPPLAGPEKKSKGNEKTKPESKRRAR